MHSLDVTLFQHLEEVERRIVWNTWKVLPNASKAFEDLLLMREDTFSSSMSLLEQFVVLLYDNTSDLVKVNDARKWLFIQ